MIGRNGFIGLCLAGLLAVGAAAQTVREKPLDDLPAIDRGQGPPARATTPPPPPPVPKAPRVTNRTAPPSGDDEAGPPARDTPPAGLRNPARTVDPPPPARRTERAPPAQPPSRSAFDANCTQQCHLACEASFEACNGDDSPAKPECVRKLESCRIQRCSCRIE